MPAGTSASRGTDVPGTARPPLLLEQFGGVAKPGLVDVGDRRADRLLVGVGRDRRQAVQHREVGPPAALRVGLDHVGQLGPGQRRRRRRRPGSQGGRSPERAETGSAWPRPTPVGAACSISRSFNVCRALPSDSAGVWSRAFRKVRLRSLVVLRPVLRADRPAGGRRPWAGAWPSGAVQAGPDTGPAWPRNRFQAVFQAAFSCSPRRSAPTSSPSRSGSNP